MHAPFFVTKGVTNTTTSSLRRWVIHRFPVRFSRNITWWSLSKIYVTTGATALCDLV